MSALFIFELKRFIRSKVLLLLAFDFAALTILAYALMFVERDLKPLYLYYIVILQFGFLFITLVISLNGIAKDVEDKNLLFYLQNNITLGRIYFVRSFVTALILLILYSTMCILYLSFFNIPINKSTIILLSFGALSIIYSGQLTLLISLISKKVTSSMMWGILSWLIIQILGSLVHKIPILAGKISLIDGNSYYMEIMNQLKDNNGISMIDIGKGVTLWGCWMIFFVVISILLIRNESKWKNEI